MDVHVERTHLLALAGKLDGQVGRHRALAHAALTRKDKQFQADRLHSAAKLGLLLVLFSLVVRVLCRTGLLLAAHDCLILLMAISAAFTRG